MFAIWIVFHVIVCVALIVVVLMQSSKGEGLAGGGTAFGGSLSGAVFGGRGAAGFLSKATTVLAIVFMVNCGALALMSAHASGVAAVGDTNGSTTTESAVTRQAQKDVQESAARQAQAQQRTTQDSAAKASGNKAAVDFVSPNDTGKK